MMQRYLLLIILGLLFSKAAYSQKQGQARIDSLLKELPKQKEDTNKVNLLNSLSYAYANINPTEGLKFGQQSLDLAIKLDWEKGIASALNRIGLNYNSKSDYSKALEYYLKSLALFEKTGNKKGMNSVNGYIGTAYYRQDDYPRALAYYFRALSLAEEIGDKMGIAAATGNVGIIYESQKDHSKALEYFTKALKLYEELGDNQGVASFLNNMAVIYQRQKEYSKALEYYAKVLKLSEDMGDKEGIMMCICNTGIVYDEQGNYTEAIDHYFKALKMAEEMGNEYEVGRGLSNIGSIYLLFAKDANKTVGAQSFSELQHRAYIPDGLIPQGRSTLLHKAVEYIQRSIAIRKKIGDLNGLQVDYENLSTADSMLGDYRGALEAYQLYTMYKDSVYNGEKKTEIMRLGMMRKMSVDSLKSAQEKQVVELKYRQQRNYTYLGIAGMILLIGFSFFIVKERGKSEKARRQSEGLLLNILPAEVAYELKDRGATTAKHYDEVTVLFTDFVNFTGAGERMGTQKLVEELHNCFKAFDEIIGKHNIEKIKTIGDAYLAVSGLPLTDSKHAENIMNAAMEIRSFMLQRKQEGHETFEVRIGIHSGPVVAGIVGVKKFAYDIWGDTVNTAARMEQSSEAGKINISQTTYELVKDKYTCTYRGEIEAKNKGMMKMYFVEDTI
jgi:adenylate cyclase